MGSKADREATLRRARNPTRHTTTGNAEEAGTEVVVTAVHVVGGAGDTTVEFRDAGDGTGDPKWEVDAPTGAAAPEQSFPQGMAFDGLHLTLPGGDEEVYLVSTIE